MQTKATMRYTDSLECQNLEHETIPSVGEAMESQETSYTACGSAKLHSHAAKQFCSLLESKTYTKHVTE